MIFAGTWMIRLSWFGHELRPIAGLGKRFDVRFATYSQVLCKEISPGELEVTSLAELLNAGGRFNAGQAGLPRTRASWSRYLGKSC
jgi:hypothetical protein